ncbi:MAG: RNA-binding protein S1, partial [Bacillota bacterium]|nr:RNA-binding protein S1 [Bacillota bacterium]
AGKIGLSIRATEEAPVQSTVKPKKARKRQAATILPEEEEQQGFNTLKEKLQEWIDQSQKEDLIKK